MHPTAPEAELVVRHDFELTFSSDCLGGLYGDGLARLLSRPAARARLDGALEEIAALARPAACYRAYPIARVLHERLELAGGTRIGGGPLASVVAGAEALYVGLCTIGPGLGERVREHAAAGRHLRMLLLDELGSLAVGQLRQQLYERIGAELAQAGWRTSSPLSPGESAWPVREQRLIFELLDAARIGVELGPGCVMSPEKSLSVVFGAGSEPMGVEDKTSCDFCTIRDTCRYAYAR